MPCGSQQLVIFTMHLCVQVRVYELGQLSLKFERHFDAEIIDFQVGRQAEASHVLRLIVSWIDKAC